MASNTGPLSFFPRLQLTSLRCPSRFHTLSDRQLCGNSTAGNGPAEEKLSMEVLLSSALRKTRQHEHNKTKWKSQCCWDECVATVIINLGFLVAGRDSRKRTRKLELGMLAGITHLIYFSVLPKGK